MVAKAFPDHVLVERQYLEDIEDDASRRAFEDSRGEESLPSDMVNLLLDGENPIRVSRRHRGLTLEVLATKVGVTKGFLSQIENGHRGPSVNVLKEIAAALRVDLDDLV